MYKWRQRATSNARSDITILEAVAADRKSDVASAANRDAFVSTASDSIPSQPFLSHPRFLSSALGNAYIYGLNSSLVSRGKYSTCRIHTGFHLNSLVIGTGSKASSRFHSDSQHTLSSIRSFFIYLSLFLNCIAIHAFEDCNQSGGIQVQCHHRLCVSNDSFSLPTTDSIVQFLTWASIQQRRMEI